MDYDRRPIVYKNKKKEDKIQFPFLQLFIAAGIIIFILASII